MNKGSIKDFRPEEGGMDKIRRVLEEEGTYMGRMENGSDVYNFRCATICVCPDKVRIGGELLVTIRHYKLQLEQKVGIKLKEIK